MRFTDEAKPLLQISADKYNTCHAVCYSNIDCVAYDYMDGWCRLFQIEAGKNLTFGFQDVCKGTNKDSGYMGIKIDYDFGKEQCSDLILLDLWRKNQTRLLKNGKRYGLREVGESVFQIYPG
ncbi:hypothetical protein B9Z55_020583 [Caenorhabditis nigoni]|uniref:Apple domain-containing protein n=1 Tax=Caenorhabditis nigoni TaxID=1611254 RepID=A0A2G5TP66_9PELO|nr:hypothetical protein B9Z55_020583 [Caenorhabditis nigoni]